MSILVTGCAGFIGMHVCKELLSRGENVIGIDNLNDYYDPHLKLKRLQELEKCDNFFKNGDICDERLLEIIFSTNDIVKVVNLAAQAGVRYSITNPQPYIQTNIVGFHNLISLSSKYGVKHFLYASSSSVYGKNSKLPFSVEDNVDYPVSLYAASKKANELIAYTYSHLYKISTTGLRYFTVYGPWGRPDMSPWLFTSAIIKGEKIQVFNHGKMLRDFTFISDIVEATLLVLNRTDHEKGILNSEAPYKIYNIGNNSPVQLMDFINTLEKVIGKKATLDFLPMQKGDVPATFADISSLESDFGFKPKIAIQEGLESWYEWYSHYIS